MRHWCSWSTCWAPRVRAGLHATGPAARRAVRVSSLLFLLSGLLIAAGGCGGTSRIASTPAAVRLQREDLVAVSHALQTIEEPVAYEVAAAKMAWPLLANGLPKGSPSTARPLAAAAADSARRIKVPRLLEASRAASLTGPASQLAGLFSTFSVLTSRGWELIVAAIDEIEHGSPAGARFARANVALYIESVYDGHFSLAQVGKKLLDGYRMLGGQAAFGTALSQAEADALAHAYSEPADRLHPHVAVRLGS